MCWEKIDEQYKERFNTNFIICEELFEISFIIQIVEKHYPEIPKDRIASAVYKAKKELPQPRLRQKFWETVSGKLGVSNM